MKPRHDLHIHTGLSLCAAHPGLTPQQVLEYALSRSYDTVCITDHGWDAATPVEVDFYREQTLDRVCRSLPLPKAEGVRFCFGCETDLMGDGRLGMTKAGFDRFDFVLIPVNHLHFRPAIRPMAIDTEEKCATYMLDRLEELLCRDLPFAKIGVPHFTCPLTCREGDLKRVFAAMPEARLLRLFAGLARAGAGLELSSDCFGHESHIREYEAFLAPYRLAKEAGCRFYFATDAHAWGSLDTLPLLGRVAEDLALSGEDLYRIP